MQRQALIQHNIIPAFSDMKLWLSLLYWILPLLSYLTTLYFIVFSDKSLPILIFFMAIMLHPLISIPFAIFTEWFRKILHYFCNRNCEHKNNSKNKFPFEIQKKGTMILYLTFIIATQLYLNYQWTIFRELTINQCGPDGNRPLNTTREKCETMFLVNNDFGSKEYDQCNCIDSFVDACVETEEIQKNIVDFIPRQPYIIQIILICNIILMLIFYFIQSFACHNLPPPVTMKDFLLGPSFQIDGDTTIVKDSAIVQSLSLNEQFPPNIEVKNIEEPLSKVDQQNEDFSIVVEQTNSDSSSKNSFEDGRCKNNSRNLCDYKIEANVITEAIDSSLNHVELDSKISEKCYEDSDCKDVERAKITLEKQSETVKAEPINRASITATENFGNSNTTFKKIKCINEKISIVEITCCFLALIFLICIFSSRSIFYPYTYEWEKFCGTGFYDTHPYPNILKCTGNFLKLI